MLSRSGTPKIIAVYENAVGDAQTTTLVSLSGLNHAIKYKDGYVYASSDTTVYRYVLRSILPPHHFPAVFWPLFRYYSTRYSDKTTKHVADICLRSVLYCSWTYNGRNPLSNMQTVVSGIPSGGHSTRTIEFGQTDDWMYVSIGSGSNVDADSSRARIKRVRIQSTTSLPITWSTMELFADGLRNEVGLRIDPFNRLWGVENGVDNLDRFTTSPALYITNPAEEVNIFPQDTAGASYGYPWCWSEGIGETANVSFPGGLGNGTLWADSRPNPAKTDDWCRSNTRPCSWALQAHAAPLDIFFDASQSLASGPVAIIPQHGSWNRPSNFRAGFRVEYLLLDSNYNIFGKDVLVQFPQDDSIRPVAGVRANCSAYEECFFFTDDKSGKGQIFVVADETRKTPFANPASRGNGLRITHHGGIILSALLSLLCWFVR